MAAQTLKRGFTTDVSPILAQARLAKGAAIDPIAAYRKSAYRTKCAAMRPGKPSLGGGIV
jgi:L-rhamnose isomerase/sugar isomerase